MKPRGTLRIEQIFNDSDLSITLCVGMQTKPTSKRRNKNGQIAARRTLNAISSTAIKNPHLCGIALAATMDQSLGKMP